VEAFVIGRELGVHKVLEGALEQLLLNLFQGALSDRKVLEDFL